jgi:two-component system, NtrC family, sensor kinase
VAKKVFQTSISKLTKTTPHALGGLLHAFASKFNAIHGYSLEVMDALPEKKHDDLKLKLMASLDSFQALLEHIQFFGKHQVRSHEKFQLDRLIEEVAGSIKKQNPSLEPNVVIKKGGDIVLHSDKILWEKVLHAVIQNACESYKDTSSAQTVSLYATQSQNTLVVTVKDEGSGIEDHHLSDIFKAFFTTKGTYRASGAGKDHQLHFGIGLTIASQILDVLGGHFEVDSDPGQGTEIKIKFSENFIS